MDAFLNKPLRNKLKASAISAIWHAHANSFAHSRQPYEPDHVASFIINGLPKMTELWSEWLSKYNIHIQITGVFCHQYPQVEFQINGSQKTTELADLLVVRRHRSGNKIDRETATLIQSKMSDDSTKTIDADDPQFYLFKNWPEFNFKQREYSSHKRNIGLLDGQSKYGLISANRLFPEDNTIWPDSCFWSVVNDLRHDMESDESFASFLEGMMAFERGRDFYSQSTTGCEWTKTICELLEVTFNKKLKTRLYSAPKRGTTQFSFLIQGQGNNPNIPEMVMQAKGMGRFDSISEGDDPTPGISTILIETFNLEPQVSPPEQFD